MTGKPPEVASAGGPRSSRLLDPTLAEARREVLRWKLGPVRTYFKLRRHRYWQFQRTLDQARLGTTYDVYLTNTVWQATMLGLLGAAVGLGLTILLAWTGVIAGLSGPGIGSVDLVMFVSTHRIFFVGAILVGCSMGVFTATTWVVRRYYPRIIVYNRQRNINIMLPHAIVYMYALSFGGMDLLEVLRRTADTEETYGEVAHEFESVIRDVDVFGKDLRTALRDARNLTPSNGLEQFLDDLMGVLDSGSDLTGFLDDESEKYMEEAQSEQTSFLETLGLLSEVFIVGFVAAPLFFIVTFIMTTLLGSASLDGLFVLVYVVLPLGIVGFIVLVSTLSAPYREPNHRVSSDHPVTAASDAVQADGRYEAFTRIARYRQVKSTLTTPIEVLVRHPWYTLAISLPAAGLWLVGLVASGVSPSTNAIVTHPFLTTILLFVVPLVIICVPLTVFHELSRHRKRHVARRLPDALDILASANGMGVPLIEAFELVARNMSGRFALELRQLGNDIRWNHDLRQALYGLADRLAVPQVTRTCRILAEGSRSTGDLHRVLAVAAEDTRHRHRLERNRRQELNTYVAVVAIGFLIYLLVVVVINHSFLTPITEQVAGSGGEGFLSFSVSAGTVAVYHAVFFHSALIQAVGSGLIIGELADNNALSGLKYSLVLVGLALVVFFFI